MESKPHQIETFEKIRAQLSEHFDHYFVLAYAQSKETPEGKCEGEVQFSFSNDTRIPVGLTTGLFRELGLASSGLPDMVIAMEWGYKAAERGWNINRSIEEFKKLHTS